MSNTVSSGLLGVSIHSSRVLGRQARSTASASLRSTGVNDSPHGWCTRANWR